MKFNLSKMTFACDGTLLLLREDQLYINYEFFTICNVEKSITNLDLTQLINKIKKKT